MLALGMMAGALEVAVTCSDPTGLSTSLIVNGIDGVDASSLIVRLPIAEIVGAVLTSFTIIVNDAPTITAIPNQTIDEETQTAALPFTISDVETATASLTVSGGSDNVTLVPVANIVFGGSTANRTVQVTPAANQFGTAVITVNVNDGTNTTATTFQVTVNSVNDLPTITAISNQVTDEDTPTSALPFSLTESVIVATPN